jgi:hypothetical protein
MRTSVKHTNFCGSKGFIDIPGDNTSGDSAPTPFHDTTKDLGLLEYVGQRAGEKTDNWLHQHEFSSCEGLWIHLRVISSLEVLSNEVLCADSLQARSER